MRTLPAAVRVPEPKQPVQVRLFVSNAKTIAPAYRSYLEKALRRAFGLEGAPLVMQFSDRRPPAPRAPKRQASSGGRRRKK